MCHVQLWLGIPETLADAVPDNMSLLYKSSEEFFQRYAAGPGDADHVANAPAALIGRLIRVPLHIQPSTGRSGA